MGKLQNCYRHYSQNCNYFLQLPNVEKSNFVCLSFLFSKLLVTFNVYQATAGKFVGNQKHWKRDV